MDIEIRDAALAYARLGWPVHPLQPRGKRPLLPNWPHAASTDPDVIRAWWDRWPGANVGIVTGPRSGLAVLDLDPRSGGAASLAELEARAGVLPGTATVITGSDGLHLYYRHPGHKVTSRAHSFGRGLDVKADGGQVVAPPSIHPTGLRYRWCGDVTGLLTGDVPGFLAPWPGEQTDTPPTRWMSAAPCYAGKPGNVLAGLLRVVLEAESGSRNNRLFWAAAKAAEHIRAGRLPADEAAAALHAAGVQVGLSPTEVDRTITSGLRSGER